MDYNKVIENNIAEHLRQPNMINYIKSYISMFTRVEDDIALMQRAIFINTAVGQELDAIGKLYSLVRFDGESDGAYRQRIKSYYQILLSYGTKNGIKKAIGILLNIGEDVVSIDEIIQYKEQLMLSFIDGDSWTGTGVTTDNDYKYFGSTGLEITGTGVTRTASLTKAFDLSSFIDDNIMFSMWSYIPDSTTVSSIKFVISDSSNDYEYEFDGWQDGGQFLRAYKSSFDGIDWTDVTGFKFIVEFVGAGEIYFDYLTIGVYAPSKKFEVTVTVSDSIETESISDLINIINISKMAGVYYNQSITYQTEDDLFFVNISEINGDDYLL